MPIFKTLKYILVRTLRTFGATFVIFWCELYEHFFFFHLCGLWEHLPYLSPFL